MEDERIRQISPEDHSKHYFEADETSHVAVEGDLCLQIKLYPLKDFDTMSEIIYYEISGIEEVNEIHMLLPLDY